MTTNFEWSLQTTSTPDPGPPTGLPGTAADRLLMFVRNVKFKALAGIFATRTANLLAAIEAVRTAFDIDSATGVQLRRLGEILQRPWYGETDDRYRLLLKIQIELILSSAGTTPTIMRIVDLFTGEAPTEYSENYPMAYVIGAQVGNDVEDRDLLLQLLRDATCAAYGATVVMHDADALILDSTGTAVAGAGTLDSTGTPVAGAGTLASARRIV
jgi:hypothetical protein